MAKVKSPFLVVNPKSYLYGKKSLELAQAVDKIAQTSNLQIFFTCPFADIRYIRENTSYVVVTAQHMQALSPGRGMGHILPESLKEAGAGAVFLNHAENTLTLAELAKTITRARELDMISIVCADSLTEALCTVNLNPDILLCEPTDLIGTNQIADDNYIVEATTKLKAINPDIAVMIASGITTADDVYNVIRLGADGTGGTNGILKAPDPVVRVQEMADAMLKAQNEKNCQ